MTSLEDNRPLTQNITSYQLNNHKQSITSIKQSLSSASTEIYWQQGPSGVRSFLPGRWSQIRLYIEGKLHDEQECIPWCMQIGILPSTMTCMSSRCRRRGREMTRHYRPERNGSSWWCSACRSEIPLTTGTIFHGSHLEMRHILPMAYCYAHQVSYKDTRTAFVWSAEASSPAKSTISEWFGNFRELVVASAAELQLNGPL